MKTHASPFLCLVLVATLLGLTGCSTTKFTTTWQAPDAQLTHLQAGDTVGALVLHPEIAARRATEEALAAELTRRGVTGVAAFSILGPTQPEDEEAARQAFAESGAVAVVVMRGVGERTEVDYRAPSYYTVPSYSGFWGGYYGYGWSTVADPGYLRTSRIVSVETLVYDLKSNQLVWGGRSETTDPTKLASFIREIVDEAAREMKKAGIIE
jgi:hypothetical protein